MRRTFAVRRSVDLTVKIGGVPGVRVRTAGAGNGAGGGAGARHAGAGALGKDAEVPFRDTPAIVNRVDIQEYGFQLDPYIKSFNDEDLLKHSIYYNPEVEYALHDQLLVQARDLDGCSGPTGCPGWGTAETAPPPLTTGPILGNRYAYEKRREAFVHYVNAVFIEERIAARAVKPSKEQIENEVALWKQWRAWIERYKKYLDDTMLSGGPIGYSNFHTMQSYDVDLQKFRNRYRSLLGREPAIASYTKPLPPEKGGIPWTGILVVAGIGAVAYALAQVKGVAGFFVPQRTPAAA